LRAEALEAELKAWDDFNARAARAAAAKASRDAYVQAQEGRFKAKRQERLQAEQLSATEAAAYRKRLQDAVAAERAEAARLDGIAAVGRGATPSPPDAAAAAAPVWDSSVTSRSPYLDDPGSLSADQRRLAQLKDLSVRSALAAAEAAVSSSQRAQQEELAARRAEVEWRARAEAWMRVIQGANQGATDVPPGITPGAADRFRARLRRDTPSEKQPNEE
jgi:hypothetical protein